MVSWNFFTFKTSFTLQKSTLLFTSMFAEIKKIIKINFNTAYALFVSVFYHSCRTEKPLFHKLIIATTYYTNPCTEISIWSRFFFLIFLMLDNILKKMCCQISILCNDNNVWFFGYFMRRHEFFRRFEDFQTFCKFYTLSSYNQSGTEKGKT